LQIEIEKLIYGGDGLARLPADEHGRGKAMFVPFVLPGEQVEAAVAESRPGFVRGRLESVIAPSPERVVPECPYFGQCGGCHYQHIRYEAQPGYKAEILRETLQRTAKVKLESDIVVHTSPPWKYRNRTRMQVRHEPEFSLGYYRQTSHDVLPVEVCPISSELIQRAITAVWTVGRAGKAPASLHGVQFFADAGDRTLLVEAYVRPASPLQENDVFADALKQELPELRGMVTFASSPVEDESRQRAPLASLHEEQGVATGASSLIYHSVGHDYQVSAGSFFQTNRFIVDELVQTATLGRTGRNALELYAGAGLFTQALAKNFDQVIAVEISPHAYADLQKNVPHNVKTVRATTERFLAERGAKLAPDLVLLDPPRAGLGEKAARMLGRMSASHVTYVSCDPATLSRDLRVLLESGFRVKQTHLVDLFPQTYHMETVLHLAR
jgi:23S rRNA (uracil1939-C5)-methyltransferase